MQIVNIWRTARVIEPIEVTIVGTNGEKVSDVVDFALEAAGETRSSIFGKRVRAVGTNVTIVELDRD